MRSWCSNDCLRDKDKGDNFPHSQTLCLRKSYGSLPNCFFIAALNIVNRAEANIFWYILPLFHSKKEILMTYSWILNFPCLTSIDKSYLTFLCQSYWKFCSSNQTCIILHESYIARLYDTAVAYCQSSSRPTTFFFFCIYLQRKKSTALCPGVFVYTAVYL